MGCLSLTNRIAFENEWPILSFEEFKATYEVEKVWETSYGGDGPSQMGDW